jgi:hypothetical protein
VSVLYRLSSLTKYVEECETLYKERCSTEYELECTTGECTSLGVSHPICGGVRDSLQGEVLYRV